MDRLRCLPHQRNHEAGRQPREKICLAVEHERDAQNLRACPMRANGSGMMALAEVGRFSRVEAQLLAGLLESHGIPALVFDAETSIADGSWLLIPARVMFDDDDLDAARTIAASAA